MYLIIVDRAVPAVATANANMIPAAIRKPVPAPMAQYPAPRTAVRKTTSQKLLVLAVVHGGRTTSPIKVLAKKQAMTMAQDGVKAVVGKAQETITVVLIIVLRLLTLIRKLILVPIWMIIVVAMAVSAVITTIIAKLSIAAAVAMEYKKLVPMEKPRGEIIVLAMKGATRAG